MINGNDLVALLGKPADDPDVVAALKHHGVRWPPEIEIEDDDDPNVVPDWYVWRPAGAAGIEFGFQDSAHLLAQPREERGHSPLVLSSVCFYGEHAGVSPFAGVLPYGLELGDGRDVVRKKLTPLECAPRSHRRDVWDPKTHRIIAYHVPRRDNILSLLFKLALLPWPPLDEKAPHLPTVAESIALFGQAWHSEDMRKLFFPLGLDKCGHDIALHRYANLRDERGLELHFYRDRTRSPESPIRDKGAGLAAVKYFRSRDQDGRGWAGERPKGLTFDLAYPQVVAVIGRDPDAGQDEPLDGHGPWHFKEMSLHVQYNNVDNLLDCISVFRPGAWRSAMT